VSGAEALPRWHEPGLGWIPRELFLPVLESATTSVQFTDYLLERVCEGLDEFARAGLEIAVSVRLPGPSLGDVLLPDRIGELAQERAIDPRRIVCVVGERSIRTDRPATLDLLVRLRVKAVGLQLDGFGTGNVRAEQLARLPLTGVRLAGSVLSGAVVDARRAGALEEALELARRLGLPAVALGCDSRADFELLLQTGCGHAQGSFIAEAMPGPEFVDWAATWSPPAPVAGDAR
jgi:EAL domain-containing protein (putative c-di-GMP-specific phosphodiesterase class I)